MKLQRERAAKAMRAPSAIAIDQRTLVEYGGFATFNLITLEDSRGDTHILRQIGSERLRPREIARILLTMLHKDETRRLVPLIFEKVTLPESMSRYVGIDFTRPDIPFDPYENLKRVLGRPMGRL